MTQPVAESQIAVTGMTCGHCRAAVDEAIRSVPGVEQVSVDLAAGRATLSGSPDLDRVLDAVRDAGYDAAVVKSSSPGNNSASE